MVQDKIKFVAHHIPMMHSGSYEIKVRQDISLYDFLPLDAFRTQQQFAIAGNRTNINTLDVHTVFPPPNSTGDHANTLPHIVIKRSTYPWEWYACKEEKPERETTPWVALLLLNEDEKPGGTVKKSELTTALKNIAEAGQFDALWTELTGDAGWLYLKEAAATDPVVVVLSPSGRKRQDLSAVFLTVQDKVNSLLNKYMGPKVVSLSELKSASTAGDVIKWPGLTIEPFEKEGEKVKVIDIEHGLLMKLLPEFDELPYLAHVRKPLAGRLSEEDPDECAIVLGNRLPAPGARNTVHLVSLENRYYYDQEHDKFLFNEQAAGAKELTRLVSLKSWEFSCFDPKKTLKHLLCHLNGYTLELGKTDTYQPPASDTGSHTLRIPAPEGTPAVVADYLSQGYAPLPHHMRHGHQTISWYKGPLATNAKQQKLSIPKDPKEELVKSADQLVRFDQTTQLPMFDVSYGAAWELGRMLTLKEKDIAIALFQWKRKHTQNLRQVEQMLVYAYLPHPDNTAKEKKFPLPFEVEKWFEGLRLLKGIPFSYLVPDEKMLPQESIRFFQLDGFWIEALLDGAFSIGRVPYKDKTEVPNSWASTPMSGFLMRSEVVSGWPDLLIDGYSHLPPDTNLDGEIALAGTKIKLLRQEVVAGNILLCIFEGTLKSVDIHLKPEAIHFGFDYKLVQDKDKSTKEIYSKILRDFDGSEVENGATFDIVWNELTRVLQLNGATGLCNGIKRSIQEELDKPDNPIPEFKLKYEGKVPEGYPNPAQFAYQMIEGVPKVRFILGA